MRVCISQRLNLKTWVKAGWKQEHAKLYPEDELNLDGRVYPIIQYSNTAEKHVKTVHSPGYVLGDTVEFEGHTHTHTPVS